jgi:thiol:disulfide interchange protein DsbC
MKKAAAILTTIAIITQSQASENKCLTKEEAEKNIKALFPNNKIDQFNESPIPCVYEIIQDGRIIYTDGKNIIIGHILDKTGKDLTAEKEEQIASMNIDKIDLSKAIKIGNGKVEVIEFTNPECPFCRRAEEMLKPAENKITRYIFFLPLEQIHPKAKELSCKILNSKEKDKTYKAIMEDKIKSGENCKEENKKVLESHIQTAMDLKIQGTPTFFVKTKNGYKKVVGANPQLLKIIEEESK